MKEGTPNIGAVCQRLAKHAPVRAVGGTDRLSARASVQHADVRAFAPAGHAQVRRESVDTAHAAGGLHGAAARDGPLPRRGVRRLPPGVGRSASVHGQCMASVKSFGDMMVGTAKALEDNIITSEERRELARLGYRAVGDILALLFQIDEAEARDRGRA